MKEPRSTQPIAKLAYRTHTSSPLKNKNVRFYANKFQATKMIAQKND
jgi:hypothetical protein